MLKLQLKIVWFITATVQSENRFATGKSNIKTALKGLTHLFLLSSFMATEDLMGLN